MKRYIATALLAFVTLCAGAAELDDVMHLLAQRTQGQVEFSEEQYISILDKPVHSSGVLVYTAPSHLEKRTLKPKPSALVVDGDRLTVSRGRRTRTLSLSEFPQAAPFVESIRATLAGDRAALEQFFTVDFKGALDDWQLSLTPKDAQVKALAESVRIAGQRDRLTQVTVTQHGGDRSVMTIGASAQ